MDTKILLDTISKALSKKLTDISIESLKDSGSIQTIKVISQSFINLADTDRADLVYDILAEKCPEVLRQHDITFVLVSKIEDTHSTDYTKLNEQKEESLKESAAAREL